MSPRAKALLLLLRCCYLEIADGMTPIRLGPLPVWFWRQWNRLLCKVSTRHREEVLDLLKRAAAEKRSAKKPSPRFKVGQTIKRTWEPETCWQKVVAINERYSDSAVCECCCQKIPDHWIVEYVFDLGGGHRGALGVEWDSEMHAKEDGPTPAALLGAKGGAAGRGSAKARPSEQAAAAARKRWAKKGRA